MKAEKVERRGKYPGTKIHLGTEASQLLIDLHRKPVGLLQKMGLIEQGNQLMLSIGKQLVRLIEEYPDLLKERTPEEVKAELEHEYESAKKKLEAIAAKQDWKQVKVPVKVV